MRPETVVTRRSHASAPEPEELRSLPLASRFSSSACSAGKRALCYSAAPGISRSLASASVAAVLIALRRPAGATSSTDPRCYRCLVALGSGLAGRSCRA
jgi:hypothetical protein